MPDNRTMANPLTEECGCCRAGMGRCCAGEPTKSGWLHLSKPESPVYRQRVVVKVYSKPLDPYAVVSSGKTYGKQYGFLKLRHVRLEKLDSATDFKVIPKTGEGDAVVFSAESGDDREAWLDALRGKSRLPPGSSTMPTLAEAEEDETAGDDDDVFGEEAQVAPNANRKAPRRRPSREYRRRSSLRSLGLRLRRQDDCPKPW
ncbi:uncharacterized protein LOC144875840 [Branchiostoma floridae x Branchiostoma japonicum]